MKLQKRLSRITCLLLVFCFALMLGSCKADNSQSSAAVGENTIQPAVLTQAENDLLALVGEQQPLLFDFTVSGASGCSVQLLTLEDGSWQPAGGSTNSSVPAEYSGRIAFTFGEDGRFSGLAFQDESGVSRITQDPDGQTFSAHASTTIADPVQITLNEPIALWVYYGEKEASASTTAYFPDQALENPERISGDFAQLITITFTK